MRIALVIERFEPGRGVENVAWMVAHRLAGAGSDVCVIARHVDPRATVEVERVSVPWDWQPLRVLAFSSAAARASAEGRFGVVHSFSRTRRQSIFRAGGGCHAAYLERAHARWPRRLRRMSPRHAVLLGMEARVFADPEQIIQCNSRLVRDQIRERYRIPDERLVVLPNGVDLERFHPSRRDAEGPRLREGISTGREPVWLLVGSGFRRKGLDTALLALSRSQRLAAELWVVGHDDPAPWRPLVGRLGLTERVRFLGPRNDLEAVYAAADALLLPTRYDAFANVCLEAAAAGLPVLTSAENGAAEILGEAGIVVKDPEDAGSFADGLDVLAEAETRTRMGAAARRVAEGYGWDRHVAALQALYRRVAG